MTYLRGGDVGAGLAVGGAGEGGGHIDVPPDAVEEPAERQREVEGAEGPDDVVAAEDNASFVLLKLRILFPVLDMAEREDGTEVVRLALRGCSAFEVAVLMDIIDIPCSVS